MPITHGYNITRKKKCAITLNRTCLSSYCTLTDSTYANYGIGRLLYSTLNNFTNHTVHFILFTVNK